MEDTNGSERHLTIAYLDATTIDVPEGLDRWTGSAPDTELMRSLERLGPLEPIGVVDLGEGKYRLAYGSRRLGAWKASPFLRDKAIPAIVVPAEDALRGTLDENAARKGLTMTEKAKLARHSLAIARDQGLAAEEVAKKLGLSRTRLAHLENAWRNELLWSRVLAGRFPVEAAVALAELPLPNVEAFLAQLDAKHPKATLRQVLALAREWMGEQVTVEFDGADLAAKAPRLVEHFLGGSPVGEGLRVRLEWDLEDDGVSMTLRLPLRGVTPAYVRTLIDRARAEVMGEAAAGTATTQPAATDGDAAADETANAEAGDATAAAAPAA